MVALLKETNSINEKMPPLYEHVFIDEIEHKICHVCKNKLRLEHFSKNSRNVDKLNNDCRKCRSEKRNKGKKDIRKTQQMFKIARAVHTFKDGKEGKECKDCCLWKSFESLSFRETGTYVDGKIKYGYRCEECRNENRRGKYAGKNKEWQQNNRDRINARKRERRRNEPNYRITENLRRRIRAVLADENKSATTIKLLGCTIEELWTHFESKFQEGMTRENYGSVWHVDHYKPCSSFDLTDPRQQRQCFNWRNLQPLFGAENISKGDTYDPDANEVHEKLLDQIS